MGKIFTANAFVYSIWTLLAALIALYVAFSIGLPRPYWALTTVYIVSQPIAGATRSKGAYRVGGTLVGAAATVALVPNLVDEPILLSVALAAWVGVCVFVATLDRTPRSYMFLLSGYTAAIIGFPSVNAPDAVWDVVVARCEEIGLGIICATAVHSLAFPRPVSRVIADRVTAWLTVVDRWAIDALGGIVVGQAARERRDVAAAVSEIDGLATHLPFDTERFVKTHGLVLDLRRRMLLLIPTLSGVADRMTALTADGHGIPAAVKRTLSETVDWVRAGADPAPSAALAAEWAHLTTLPPRPYWRELLAASLADRVERYVRLRSEASELLAGLAEPHSRAGPFDEAERERLPLDVRNAAVSGLAIFCSVTATCLFWIVTGWPNGATAPVAVAMFGSFLAGQDATKPATILLIGVAVVAAPLACLYSFVVLPSISGFPMLAMVLSPTLLVLGVLLAHPVFGRVALNVIASFSAVLALQPTYQAEFASFANVVIALLLGILATIGLLRWFRGASADGAARRLLRLNWRDLGREGGRSGLASPALSARLLDRIGTLSPKLASPHLPHDLKGLEALRDLRTGLNLIAVEEARDVAPPPARPLIDHVVWLIRHYFTSLARSGEARPPPETLRVAIDDGIAGWADTRSGADSGRGLLSLVALRRNLFPDSPGFRRHPVPSAS